LSLALARLGQSVPVLCADPVPPSYAFLPTIERVTSVVPAQLDLAIVLDAGSRSQLGALAPALGNAATVVWIDHHPTNPGGGDLDYLDPSAAATALQVYRVIEALGVAVEADIATCLYCGIATDTGFFTFQNTSPEALAAAAELAAAGADPFFIATESRGRIQPAAARLRGRALANLQMLAAGRIILAALTPGDFAAAGAGLEDTENIIDLLKPVAGGEVQVLMKAADPGPWRVSLRSSTLDVAAIAQQFGGGGHVAAAGCSLTGSLPEVRARILKALMAALDQRE